MASLSELPPFSPVVTRLLALLSNEDVSFTKVAALVEKDPVIAANLLRMVNSAIYGRRGTVSSIRHALAIIGVNKVRNTILALSIGNIWNRIRPPQGWSMRDFNRHASAAAVLADQLVMHVPVVYPEGAFTAGLLHDIGKLLIAVSLPDLAKKARTLAEEEQILGFGHDCLSEAALTRWDLPAPVLEAVRNHHQAAPGSKSLAAIVRAADQCVNRLSITSQPDARVEGDPLQALAEVGLEETAGRILDDFQREMTVPETLLSTA